MEWDIVWVWCPSLPKVGMLEVGCGGQQQQRVMGAISRSSPSFGGGVEEERPKAMTRCGVVGVVVASSLRRCRIARAREPSNEPSNQLGGCVCVWLCVDLRTSPTPHIHPPTPLQHPEYLSRGPRHNQQPHTLTHVNATVPAISHHTHTPRPRVPPTLSHSSLALSRSLMLPRHDGERAPFLPPKPWTLMGTIEVVCDTWRLPRHRVSLLHVCLATCIIYFILLVLLSEHRSLISCLVQPIAMCVVCLSFAAVHNASDLVYTIVNYVFTVLHYLVVSVSEVVFLLVFTVRQPRVNRASEPAWPPLLSPDLTATSKASKQPSRYITLPPSNVSYLHQLYLRSPSNAAIHSPTPSTSTSTSTSSTPSVILPGSPVSLRYHHDRLERDAPSATASAASSSPTANASAKPRSRTKPPRSRSRSLASTPRPNGGPLPEALMDSTSSSSSTSTESSTSLVPPLPLVRAVSLSTPLSQSAPQESQSLPRNRKSDPRKYLIRATTRNILHDVTVISCKLAQSPHLGRVSLVRALTPQHSNERPSFTR